ncbi:MAG: hypothetical protein ALECFALPRED_000489 [Alectoria fallacina]|uniref:Uncharacterized protein n=1 Tax=Alectoria fallacina TaxID=1903189 RepID=A0A8H3PL59_9LECA|nr:MAG: hypothetical protein ALECFALPRED_000489 [Alectoria fallacina]
MMLLRSFENGLATGLGCTLWSGVCVTIDPLRAFQVKQLMRRVGVRKFHEAIKISLKLPCPNLLIKEDYEEGVKAISLTKDDHEQFTLIETVTYAIISSTLASPNKPDLTGTDKTHLAWLRIYSMMLPPLSQD